MDKVRIKPLVNYGLLAVLSLCYMIWYMPNFYYRNFSLLPDVLYFYLARPGFIIGVVACLVVLAVDLLELEISEKNRKRVKLSALLLLAVVIVYLILIVMHVVWLRFLPLTGIEWPFNLVFVFVGLICGLYAKKESNNDRESIIEEKHKEFMKTI